MRPNVRSPVLELGCPPGMNVNFDNPGSSGGYGYSTVADPSCVLDGGSVNAAVCTDEFIAANITNDINEGGSIHNRNWSLGTSGCDGLKVSVKWRCVPDGHACLDNKQRPEPADCDVTYLSLIHI